MKTFENGFKLYTGRHSATFLGVEEQVREDGPCLLWKFMITHGYYRNYVNRYTGPFPTRSSDCERFLSQILGWPAMEGDLAFLSLHIDEMFTVYVDYHNGYPRVEDVLGPESN